MIFNNGLFVGGVQKCEMCGLNLAKISDVRKECYLYIKPKWVASNS